MTVESVSWVHSQMLASVFKSMHPCYSHVRLEQLQSASEVELNGLKDGTETGETDMGN